jgi:hypothetical protein
LSFASSSHVDVGRPLGSRRAAEVKRLCIPGEGGARLPCVLIDGAAEIDRCRPGIRSAVARRHYAAAHGAQGAEILLDAIARSDGTRASVTDEVRRTQVRNGILGDIAFDGRGDLVEAPITILRFTRGDFVVDRLVRVQPPAASP